MASACPDEMVSAITLVGSVDEVRGQMRERAQDADSITPVVPQFGLEADKAAIYQQRIAELFYQ